MALCIACLSMVISCFTLAVSFASGMYREERMEEAAGLIKKRTSQPVLAEDGTIFKSENM